VTPTGRRYAAIYVSWIALCAVLFFALQGREDPSRRRGRILSNEAGERAVALLRGRDPARFAGYDAVHVAWAGRNEAGSANRWIVLCDRTKRTALRDAVVVELRGEDGALLAIRRPIER
jgi:hypothetical protein